MTTAEEHRAAVFALRDAELAAKKQAYLDAMPNIYITRGGRGAGKTYSALKWVGADPSKRRYATNLRDALMYASWGFDVMLDQDTRTDDDTLSIYNFQSVTPDEIKDLDSE